MYTKAVDIAETSLGSDPNNLDALIMTAAATAALQNVEQAQAAARAVHRAKPDFSAAQYAAAKPYKDPRKAVQFISMLEKAGIQEKS